MTETISACIVVHNEERLIERCLRSLVGVVDEIIVVHDGPCEDRTLEICREYTDKVFIRPFFGACDPHRVFAFEKATGSWILMIDADEYLSEELRVNLRSLINREDVDLYCFIWPYTAEDGLTPISIQTHHPYRACLARKSKLFFIGLVHEPLRTYGQMKKVPLVLYHAPGYDQYRMSTFLRRRVKWAKLAARGLWQPIEKIPIFGVSDKEVINKILESYRKYSFIKIFTRFGRILAWHMYKGMWRLGVRGLKIALLGAFDVAMIQFYTWRYRK